jgi:hypothetical protein
MMTTVLARTTMSNFIVRMHAQRLAEGKVSLSLFRPGGDLRLR